MQFTLSSLVSYADHLTIGVKDVHHAVLIYIWYRIFDRNRNTEHQPKSEARSDCQVRTESIVMALLQVLASVSLVWLIWQVARNYLLKSPLDNIPGPKPSSWLTGHINQLFDRHGWKFQDDIGENYGPVVKLQSLFGRKALFVFDPRALHNIVIKEPYTYEPAEWFTIPIRLMLGPGVLVTYGDLHRRQRKMLNPVFSIKHMRSMTPLFYRVAYNLRNGIKNHLSSSSQDSVDILHWMHRTALELIGQGGLGYSFDPLNANTQHTDLTKAMKDLSATLFNSTAERMTVPFLVKLGPSWLRRWLLEFVPNQRVQRLKEISDIMTENTRHIFLSKKAALEAGDEAVKEQVANGNDIMSILLNANMNASDEDKLSEEELLGQMSILIFAATDTTTTALSQALHLLAEHPDIQDKLRAEIKDAQAKTGGEIPHDELMALPYLDAVCRETLRLRSPLTFISREARKDTVLPLSKPIRGIDGQMMSEVHIPKSTTIVIGIRASNLNRSIWGDDVREWKPERWLGRIPEAVTEAHLPGVYSNLMTFNGGSRSCIGFKFSQLEMKVVLAVLLSSFKFTMNERSKQIVWNMAGIMYPTVGKHSKFAEFPMSLTPLEE
ncbi:hypothetical protein QCA50_020068 [Cerrena zonata]|uniref:Cytochrome P450 n=1 Tax=Cerrena zonata TaxID=2478898 RepID=A0AAW0F875_9APHY